MATLQEALDRRDLRSRLSKLHDEHKIQFRVRPGKSCSCCGKQRHDVGCCKIMKDDEGRLYAKTWTENRPLPLHPFAGEGLLCRDCFMSEIYNKPVERTPCLGGRHGSIPNSQRQYDGENFHSGEW